MLPNFLLIGAMKCGTTSLADQLTVHPDIFVSDPKEPHFFAWNQHWERGIEWYESLFRDAEAAKAVGEASTTYTMHPVAPDVPPRIAQTLADVRFLYIVRHPIDRLVSHYMHRWYEGNTSNSLEAAIESDTQLLAYSRYHYQIQQYLPHFPPDRFLVLVFEEFTADPVAVHQQVYRFLGVDPSFVPGERPPKNVTDQKVRHGPWVRAARHIPFLRPIANTLFPATLRRRFVELGGKRKPRPEMSKALYDKLVDDLRPDIEGLSDFTRRDFRKIWNLGPG
jgi:hypothetical protein